MGWKASNFLTYPRSEISILNLSVKHQKKDKEDEIKGAWLTNASPDGYKRDEIYRKLLIPLCIGRKKIWLKILISYFNHS